MSLSRNERLVLEAIRDDVFDTVWQVARAVGLPNVAAEFACRKLWAGGLLDRFEVTYAGHKALADEPLRDSDLTDHVGMRPAK